MPYCCVKKCNPRTALVLHFKTFFFKFKSSLNSQYHLSKLVSIPLVFFFSHFVL